MRYHPLLVLSILNTGFRTLATSLRPLEHWGDMRVKHAWDTVPESWESLGHPPAEATMDLHIALKSQHENALVDALLEVSDPAHPKYGAHFSKEQVFRLIEPHSDTLRLVNSWLKRHGVPSSMVSIKHGGSWLTVSNVRVSQANNLLGASYQLYRHAAANSTVLRTISYGLPEELHVHVKSVAPTTYFGLPRTPRQTSLKRPRGGGAALSSRADEYVTPSYLRWMYKTMGYVPKVAGQNRLGIAGFLNQYPSPDDLRIFLDEYRTDAVDATFSVEKASGGGYDAGDPHLEPNNNIQYATAIAYPTPVIFYSTRGTFYYEDDMFLNWLDFLLIQDSIPQTISVSYGIFEYAVPQDLAEWVCVLFGELGLRGVSVIFASGDNGVGPENCMDEKGNVHFLPTFPASCPWITSVGGTTSHDPEEAASISGGGFSNYFPRPPYQENAVNTYLTNLGTKHEGSYNPKGRGIPDLSAQASNFIAVNGRNFWTGSGTSYAAPTVAGIVSLVNDYLISNKKDPLGFLNPWLYGKGFAALNDITSGSNPGCGTVGFSAVVGWDPVTGLGTPDFDELEELIDG